MKGIRTSAPGKVVVTGEYAVLDGGPAVVMAVDRRAKVCVSAGEGGWHRLSAPGLLDGTVDFVVDRSGEVKERAGSSRAAVDLSLVAEVMKAAGAHRREPLRLDLDTRPFFREGVEPRKLGFGSSAAIAVALTAALMHDDEQQQDLLRTAVSAHRAWQGGRGSGVDVAAAVQGGVLAFRAAADPAVEPLRWPDGLHYRLLWSGRPASTRAKVRQLKESGSSARGRSGRDAAGRLLCAADEALDAWRTGDPRSILASLSAWVRALQAFEVDRALGIFDAGHRGLVEAAAGRHVVYKPCGAGGGDVGMALAPDEDSLEQFVALAEGQGFEQLNVALDTRGVEECR